MNEEPETEKSANPWKLFEYAFYILAGIMLLEVALLQNGLPPFEEWPLVNQYCFYWSGVATTLSTGLMCRAHLREERF